MLNLEELLATLAVRRPIFHSEADFQHALAWEIQRWFPDAAIRLERPFSMGERPLYLDVWIQIAGRVFAVELKYKTRKLVTEYKSEPYSLRDQGAQDCGRYDFVKDIQRLEQVTDHDQQVTGYALFLTNDTSYWTPTRKDPVPVDYAFRLWSNRELQGVLSWGFDASPGTIVTRESPLELSGNYAVAWQDYSHLSVPKNGTFRYLLLQVNSR